MAMVTAMGTGMVFINKNIEKESEIFLENSSYFAIFMVDY